jgi:Tfp pilus assembly protein PilV
VRARVAMENTPVSRQGDGKLPAFARRVSLASERADTLIEVLVSSMVIAIIIMGTFNALDTTNRASALGRARSQAQALAEKDQERLRGEPISKLAALNGTTTTTEKKFEGNTTVKVAYTIKSSVTYINESGVSDCAAEAAEGYYKTVSEVTWSGMGHNSPIIETGSIAPPAGATLIVRVEGAEKGAGVEGMEVKTVGPGSTGTVYEEKTTSEGCALFGPFENGGEYTVNVKRAGYVDQNWYSEVKEDPEAKLTWNLLLNVATKAAYRFAPAGTLKANITTVRPSTCTEKCTWSPETKVQNVMVSNSEGMHPETRTLLKTSSLRASPLSSESPGVFPFPTAYAAYAGTCEENNPTKFAAADPSVKVPPAGTGEAEVPIPAMIVKVYNKGTAEAPSELLTESSKINKIVVKDTGCAAASQSMTLANGAEEIERQGDLKYPGLPYGKYTVCNEWTESGKAESVEVTGNENPAHEKNYDPVQLVRTVGKAQKSCPS